MYTCSVKFGGLETGEEDCAGNVYLEMWRCKKPQCSSVLLRI